MTTDRTNRASSKKKVTRRELLQMGAGVGLTTAGAALLGACGAPLPASPTAAPAAKPTTAPAQPAATAAPKPAATTAPAPAAKPAATAEQPVTLNFFGWAFLVEKVQETLDQFKKENPTININYTAYPTQQWRPQITAVFVAGTPVVDAMFLREEVMGSFVDAGYLQPIEGFPGVEEYKKQLYPGALADMMYKGKIYGLPYFTSFSTFVVNKKMLNDAGLTAAPKTWDEVKSHAEAIRKAKVMDSPLMISFRKSEFYKDWWSVVYASGGRLFDDNDEPVFAGKDPVAQELLERFADLFKSKLLSVQSLEADSTHVRDAFMAGQAPMATMFAHYFQQIKDPKQSKVPADALLANVPSLDGQMKGTVAWTRAYVMGAKTKYPDKSFQLVNFLGGKNKSGDFWTAKLWLTTGGQFSGFKPVMEDPKIQESIAKWFDPKLFAAQQAIAKTREAQKNPWFPEWDDFNQEQIQSAVLGKVTAKEALKTSSDKALELKRRK